MSRSRRFTSARSTTTCLESGSVPTGAQRYCAKYQLVDAARVTAAYLSLMGKGTGGPASLFLERIASRLHVEVGSAAPTKTGVNVDEKTPLAAAVDQLP